MKYKCLEILNRLSHEDQDAINDRIDEYRKALDDGDIASRAQMAKNAVNDHLADLKRERAEMMSQVEPVANPRQSGASAEASPQNERSAFARTPPERTADTMSDAIALSSPNGRMSGAARERANERLRQDLFGKDGLQREDVAQPSQKESLLQKARELRDLAGRGMKPRAYLREAEELERRAGMLAQADVPEQRQSSASTADSEPALELKGETEAEIKQREALQKKADDEKKAKDNAPPPEGFTLTGSDRAADVAEAHGQKPLFKRKPQGISAPAVRSIVRKATAEWKNAPEVEVIDSMADAPRAVREENDAQLAQGATGQPAAFYHDGKVYLVASEIANPREAVSYLFHEALGHHGLRGVFGDKLDSVLSQLASARGADIAAKAKQYGLDISKREDRLIAAEEVLAELAQSRPDISFVRKVVAQVRTYLRDLGLDIKYSDDEIINNFILPARGFVERGQGGVDAGTRFHRAYHGSPHDFDRFDTSKIGTGEGAQAFGYGLYFAGKKEVAQHYKDKLSTPRGLDSLAMEKDGKRLTGPELLSEYFEPGAVVHTQGGLYDKVLSYDPQREQVTVNRFVDAELKRHDLGGWRPISYGVSHWTQHQLRTELIPALEKKGWKKQTGRMYEVELAPHEDHYLDYDKTYDEQSPYVKKALEKVGIFEEDYAGTEETGQRIYHDIGFGRVHDGDFGGDRAASKLLDEAGIPGIKFLDASSRRFGGGVVNYELKQIGDKWTAVTMGKSMGPQHNYFDTKAEAQDWIDRQQGGHHNYVIFSDRNVEVKAKFARTADATLTKPEKDRPAGGAVLAAVKDTAKAWAEDLQKAVVPMATGSDRARAIAKDYANAERLARSQWAVVDERLKRLYTPDQLKKMWDAADEQNVLMQEGKDTTGKGLDRLNAKERGEVERLHKYANDLLAQAKDVGLFNGEGLPYWTPRMVANIGKDGEFLSEPKSTGGASSSPYSSPTGRNITTSSSSLRHREHLTTAETEAAAKAKLGEDAQVVRNIRTMPLAMARLERAIAGRQLINEIKAIGQKTGQELVSHSDGPQSFTVDHPAFKVYKPRLDEVDGKWVTAKDAEGNVIMDKVPLYVSKEFEGPLKAIMTDKPGVIYSGLMQMKAKATGLIMYSPLIHNGVEWGRAMPLMPGKVLTFRVYFEGNKVKNDPEQMREFVSNGMVPIGSRFGAQDISGILEEPTLKPGRSLTAKAAGAVVGTVNKAAAERVKSAIDTAGDFWHNTLLWDRVADLQAGIASNMRDELIGKGLDRQTAVRVAAHLANRFAGALPNEAMSAMARKALNLTLFSRTFTVGNLGVLKDMITGLPKDVQAQIMRDAGPVAYQAAKSAARQKAIHAFMLDIALMYGANAALQSAFDYLKRDKSLDQIAKGYVDRFNKALDRIKQSPTDLLNVFGNLESLSPTGGNEPGKENRVLFGKTKDGTAVYVRLPTGKIGEEFTEWPLSPLEMLRKKQGTLARPTLQMLANDKGFGRQVYDPIEKGISGIAHRIGSVAWNYMSQQIPEASLESAFNMMRGKGNETDTLKAVGPLFGVTFSKGAPGGPAVGQMFDVENRHRHEKERAMPEVNQLLRDGDRESAIKLMREAHFSQDEMRITEKYAEHPGSRLNSERRQRNFNQNATPEERDRMRRLREDQ